MRRTIRSPLAPPRQRGVPRKAPSTMIIDWQLGPVNALKAPRPQASARRVGTPKAQGWPKQLTSSTLQIRITSRHATSRPIAGGLTDYAGGRIRRPRRKLVSLGRCLVGGSQGRVGNAPPLFVSKEGRQGAGTVRGTRGFGDAWSADSVEGHRAGWGMACGRPSGPPRDALPLVQRRNSSPHRTPIPDPHRCRSRASDGLS